MRAPNQAIEKPAKPYPDFPLFAHATRRWAKKIKGKLHYFGPWADPMAAEKKYQEQREDLYAGRTPRIKPGALQVRDVLNHFLTAKQLLMESGELTPRTWADYHATCERIAAAFGRGRLVEDLRPDDFAAFRADAAKRWGPRTLGNEVQRVRTVFRHAYEARLIDQPIHLGPGFKKPGKKLMREARNARGLRMFEPAELRQLLDAANVTMKAMVLLGINCGYGNADCGKLPLSAIDFDGATIDYPRPKTGVPRRCPLWPETIEALRAAIAARPRPRSRTHAGLAFVTVKGLPWAKVTASNPVTKEMVKLQKAAGLTRPGLSFYALRHTLETVGGETLDQAAVDAIMGHERSDMATVYRERLTDERLQRVTDHVRAWLFPVAKKGRRAKLEPKRGKV